MPKTWRSVKPLFSNIDKFAVLSFSIARRFGHLKPRCGERFHTLQSQDSRNAIKANGSKFGNRLEEISIRSLTNISHGSFLLNRVIILNVSVPSTQLFVLCRVQIPDLISVHEQPCNAVLNKHKHQGNESKQTNPTSGCRTSNYSSLLFFLPVSETEKSCILFESVECINIS